MTHPTPADPPALRGDAAHPGYARHLETACLAQPQVFIELTSVCNYHCFYCESHEHPRKTAMEPGLFHRVLDQVAALTPGPIHFHCDGEPTLHKHFYEFAQAANAKGLKITLITNGSNLQRRFLDLAMSLSIHVSTSPEEFKLRSDIDFGRYLAGLKDYVRGWLDSPSRQILRLNFYLTARDRASPDTLDRIRRFADQFLADVGIEHTLAGVKPNSTWYTHEKPNRRALILSARNIASGGLYPEVDPAKPVGLPREFGFCDSPWKRLVILADGRLQACCIDLKGTLAYTAAGELDRHSLRELWERHPEIQRLRRDFLEGKAGHPTCRRCLDRLPSREFYIPSTTPFQA